MTALHQLDRPTLDDAPRAATSDWGILDLVAAEDLRDLEEVWEGVFHPEPPRVPSRGRAWSRRVLDLLLATTHLALAVTGVLAADLLLRAVAVLELTGRTVTVHGSVALPATQTVLTCLLVVGGSWLAWQLALIGQLRALGRRPGSVVWAVVGWVAPVLELVTARRVHLRIFRAAGPNGIDAQVPVALRPWSRNWFLARVALLVALLLAGWLPVVAAVLLPLGLVALVLAVVHALRLTWEVHAKVDALGAAAGLRRWTARPAPLG